MTRQLFHWVLFHSFQLQEAVFFVSRQQFLALKISRHSVADGVDQLIRVGFVNGEPFKRMTERRDVVAVLVQEAQHAIE